ncbi:MAG: 50S ribosomal protein L19 [bacterium]
MEIKGIIVSPVDMAQRKTWDMRGGDTVKVTQKIKEKGKVRLQVFEGIVLARKHGSDSGATFTVRKTASGVGVERVFPLYSPNIDSLEVIKRANVRRAKLYHIRHKATKEINKQMRKVRSANDEAIAETASKNAPKMASAPKAEAAPVEKKA